jgi:hypothetical protein
VKFVIVPLYWNVDSAWRPLPQGIETRQQIGMPTGDSNVLSIASCPEFQGGKESTDGPLWNCHVDGGAIRVSARHNVSPRQRPKLTVGSTVSDCASPVCKQGIGFGCPDAWPSDPAEVQKVPDFMERVEGPAGRIGIDTDGDRRAAPFVVNEDPASSQPGNECSGDRREHAVAMDAVDQSTGSIQVAVKWAIRDGKRPTDWCSGGVATVHERWRDVSPASCLIVRRPVLMPLRTKRWTGVWQPPRGPQDCRAVAHEGRFNPAVQFDAARGYPHRDTLDWDGHAIEKEWRRPQPLAVALTEAEDDIRANWQRYHGCFFRSQP